ncbi:DUF1906 domain-containing protein [Evansella sp. AB-P1]|uniref:glycoside hydrolase domain-containing protein n=1 Tax=Evansella sp. AB-P1 TaxID=3037653 RepID=UPI00241FFB32|nr:glycoside hydrolase domain-containing protein [Evansella sp. AB-P1]MDG5788448.1 DUF1906 domain-containing protein [Evansella sp. AB-P1]
MYVKRLIPFITAFMLFIVTAFSFYMYGSSDRDDPVAAKLTESELESSTSDGNGESSNTVENSIENQIEGEDSQINSTIENNINIGDNGTVDNSITNNITGKSGNIDNSITNEIDGNAAEVNNNIENIIEGDFADVRNAILNNIYSGFNIDNSVSNNIDVNVTNNFINNIENNVVGEGEEVDDPANGNGNGDDQDNGDTNGDTNGNGQDNGDATNGESSEPVWGVDSASLTTESMLACVTENFGDPQIWGRYLGDKEGVSYGLTHEEVELLHENDIQILVIWNHFTDATGYEKGQSEAEAAIEMARDFGIPEEVALFANVEPIYPIDSAFLLGWYDTIEESEYTPGVYGIFHPDRELYVAFEAAVEENSDLLDNYYVWTSSPDAGITTEENAPEYNPEAPEGSLIAGWQYGIDAETCNIDTNWYSGDVLDVLW